MESLQSLVDLAHSRYPEVQRDAAAAFHTLSLNSDNQDQLVAAGCLRPLVLLAGGTDLLVRRDALGALAQLTTHEKFCAMLSESGGLGTLVSCRTLSSRDSSTVRSSAQCLFNFASSSERGALVRAGGLGCLLHLLQHTSRPVQKLAVLAIQQLAAAGTRTRDDPEGDGYAELILEEHALRPVLELMTRSSMVSMARQDNELRKHACKVGVTRDSQLLLGGHHPPRSPRCSPRHSPRRSPRHSPRRCCSTSPSRASPTGSSSGGPRCSPHSSCSVAAIMPTRCTAR